MKLKNKSRGKLVGLSSFIAVFALLATAVFCPFDGNNVEAATRSSRLRIDFVVREALSTGRLKIDFFLTKSGGIDYESIAKQLGIDFYVKEKIYLGVSGLGDVSGGTDITPEVKGTSVSGTTDFKVGTNNAGGLSVLVSSTNPNMVNAEYAGNVIVPTSETKKLGSLATNTWGYGLLEKKDFTDVKNVDLVGVATEASEPMSLSTGDHDMTLAFGAMVGAGVASGTYSSTVKVDVATNPTGRAIRDDNLRTIERVVNEYMEEHPEEKARLEEAQAKAKAEYEARMNGEAVEEEL